MTFWDQTFDAPGYQYGTEPNAFLRVQAQRLHVGSTVLAPGDGEGRNGVWLARQGHAVLSVDSSAVGLRKPGELAAEHGVLLRTLQADLAAWTPAPASADAVVLTYVHLPAELRRAVHRNPVSCHASSVGICWPGPRSAALRSLSMPRHGLRRAPCAARP